MQSRFTSVGEQFGSHYMTPKKYNLNTTDYQLSKVNKTH
jgi:hypothetical protein